MSEFRYFLNGDRSQVVGFVKADTRSEALAKVLEMHSTAKSVEVQGENFMRSRKQILRGDTQSRKPN